MIWFQRKPKQIAIDVGTRSGLTRIEHVVKHEWSQRPLPMSAELMWFATDGRPIYHDYRSIVGGDLEIAVPPMIFQYGNDSAAQIKLRVIFKYPPRA